MSEGMTFFQGVNALVLDSAAVVDALMALLAAFIFSQVLAWVYERTYRGLSYSAGYTHTLVLSSMSAALLIQAMRHSIIAGLGLLAALSMIRFRSTLKAPKDLVFIMASITLGIACGAGAFAPASVGTVCFAAAALYLHVVPLGTRTRFDGVLRFRTAADVPLEPRLTELLDEHCRRRMLLSVGEVAQGTRVEHAYQVKLRSERNRAELLDALRSELSASEARLLMQEATFEY